MCPQSAGYNNHDAAKHILQKDFSTGFLTLVNESLLTLFCPGWYHTLANPNTL